MPWVQRNVGGDIIGLYAKRQNGFAEEFIADAVLPPVPPPLNIDMLNAVLASKGSVVRAVTVLMFGEINKLRVKNGDPAYTMAQFKNALDAEMDAP